MEGEEYIKGSSVAGLICCIIPYSSQGGPGGPVAETLLSVQGPEFDPWPGNEISHAATKRFCMPYQRLKSLHVR